MDRKITETDFRKGINLFIEILKTQPGMITAQAPSTISGLRLAEMATAFSNKYNEIKSKHYGD